MFSVKKFFFAITALTILVAPQSTFAQGIVTCGHQVNSTRFTYDCGTCELIAMANGVIDFLITIMLVISALIFVWAGYLMVTSGGSRSQFERAKNIFTNVVIGLVIMLCAWLAIDIVMRMLANGGNINFGQGQIMPWNQIVCSTNQATQDGAVTEHGTTQWPNADEYLNGNLIDEGGMVTTVITPSGTPATITGNIVTVNGRQFDAGIASNVRYLADTYGLTISGGMRTPERNAAVNGSPTSYHLSGRAADFVGTAAQMNAAADWARRNGAIEVLVHNAGSGTHLHVAW